LDCNGFAHRSARILFPGNICDGNGLDSNKSQGQVQNGDGNRENLTLADFEKRKKGRIFGQNLHSGILGVKKCQNLRGKKNLRKKLENQTICLNISY